MRVTFGALQNKFARIAANEAAGDESKLPAVSKSANLLYS